MPDLRHTRPISSIALEGSHVYRVGYGALLDAYCTSTSFAGYLMVFDAASDPADGAVTPMACVAVPISTSVSVGFAAGFPVPFSNGLVLVFSTTGPFTKTESATAFLSARIL